MVTFDGLLPWTDTEHVRKPVPSGKVWRYSAQCGIYNISVVADQLEEKLGAHDDVAESRNTGKSRLFDVSFSNKGIPQATSFMLSMPAWAASQVLNHDQGVKALKTPVSPDLTGLPALSDTLPMMDSGFPEFDQLTLHIMQWIDAEAVRLQRDELAADVAWIETLGELVLEKTGLPARAVTTAATTSRRSVVFPVPGGPLTAKIPGVSAFLRHSSLTANCWLNANGYREGHVPTGGCVGRSLSNAASNPSPVRTSVTCLFSRDTDVM